MTTALIVLLVIFMVLIIVAVILLLQLRSDRDSWKETCRRMTTERDFYVAQNKVLVAEHFKQLLKLDIELDHWSRNYWALSEDVGSERSARLYIPFDTSGGDSSRSLVNYPDPNAKVVAETKKVE